MRDTIEMAREAGLLTWLKPPEDVIERFKAFEALVRADERMSFYGQDKPVECADGCPPNQICDYCQVVAPVKAMILAERERLYGKDIDTLLFEEHRLGFEKGSRSEREACAKEADKWSKRDDDVGAFIGKAIRARGETQ
jgi:hypothetical protein